VSRFERPRLRTCTCQPARVVYFGAPALRHRPWCEQGRRQAARLGLPSERCEWLTFPRGKR
jgi:hypothetical protein